MEVPLRPCLLVIEDDEAVREVLDAILSSRFRVVSVDSTARADEEIASCSPDLILCDVALPVRTGLEFTECARSRGFSKPVLLMSGFVDEFSESRARTAGANAFLTKPFDFQELLATVERFLVG